MDETQVPETTETPETEEVVVETTPEAPAEEHAAPEKESSDLEAKNRQLYERAKRAEAEAKAAKAREDALRKQTAQSFDVEDYIGISAALEGLSQREKEKLAQEHKMTGKTLVEIRQSEDFQLWQSALRAKEEKERALKPSGTQPEHEKAKSLSDRLSGATTKDKEKLLVEAGLIRPSETTEAQFAKKILVP